MAPASVEAIVAQLRDGGTRVTTARRLLLTTLLNAVGHPTADELLAAVRAMAPDVHASTVYRNLEELERLGVVVHTHLGHGAATYHLATEAHGHLVCENCGATIEASSDVFDGLADAARTRYGFTLRPYHFAVLGICAACAQAGAEA
jgi:Fur family transcriptional regulator, ferric uptake regulator